MKKNKKENIKSIKLSVYFTILTSIAIIATSSAMLLCTFLNINDFSAKCQTEISTQIYAIASTLGEILKIDARRNDYTATRTIVDTMKDKGILHYIYIKNNKTGKTEVGVKDFDTQEIDDSDNKRNDVQALTTILGDYTLYMGIPEYSFIERYKKDLASKIMSVVAGLIAISIFVGIIMSDIVSKPLGKLSFAAKQIMEGNFKIQIKKSMFKEINELIHSYNKMGHELDELYSSLELKVQERTIALEAANTKLKETQAMMVHSEKMRSLGELVAGIAHEINNPVNFIHGNIMILQNYASDLIKLIDLYDSNKNALTKEKIQEIEDLRKEIDIDFLRDDIKDLIKSCIEGTERTKNIVLDLKNFSRMEEMVLTQFDIPKEIDTTLNILNNKYKNRITVIKNYSPDVPKIEAYGGQLNQVFMNILDNAQDAMKESGTLTINVNQKDTNVVIEFIDTGMGIPEENLKKVFEPFFTTKPVGKGTGLGMSISYRVIKDHQGTINVESEVGKGTKFTIVLPINHTREEETISENESENKALTEEKKV